MTTPTKSSIDELAKSISRLCSRLDWRSSQNLAALESFLSVFQVKRYQEASIAIGREKIPQYAKTLRLLALSIPQAPTDPERIKFNSAQEAFDECIRNFIALQMGVAERISYALFCDEAIHKQNAVSYKSRAIYDARKNIRQCLDDLNLIQPFLPATERLEFGDFDQSLEAYALTVIQIKNRLNACTQLWLKALERDIAKFYNTLSSQEAVYLSLPRASASFNKVLASFINNICSKLDRYEQDLKLIKSFSEEVGSPQAEASLSDETAQTQQSIELHFQLTQAKLLAAEIYANISCINLISKPHTLALSRLADSTKERFLYLDALVIQAWNQLIGFKQKIDSLQAHAISPTLAHKALVEWNVAFLPLLNVTCDTLNQIDEPVFDESENTDSDDEKLRIGKLNEKLRLQVGFLNEISRRYIAIYQYLNDAIPYSSQMHPFVEKISQLHTEKLKVIQQFAALTEINLSVNRRESDLQKRKAQISQARQDIVDSLTALTPSPLLRDTTQAEFALVSAACQCLKLIQDVVEENNQQLKRVDAAQNHTFLQAELGYFFDHFKQYFDDNLSGDFIRQFNLVTHGLEAFSQQLAVFYDDETQIVAIEQPSQGSEVLQLISATRLHLIEVINEIYDELLGLTRKDKIYFVSQSDLRRQIKELEDGNQSLSKLLSEMMSSDLIEQSQIADELANLQAAQHILMFQIAAAKTYLQPWYNSWFQEQSFKISVALVGLGVGGLATVLSLMFIGMLAAGPVGWSLLGISFLLAGIGAAVMIYDTYRDINCVPTVYFNAAEYAHSAVIPSVPELDNPSLPEYLCKVVKDRIPQWRFSACRVPQSDPVELVDYSRSANTPTPSI